jgi:hypothetical protein
MCTDHPIRNVDEYRSQVIILTKCCGPVKVLAHTYRDLVREVRPFYPSFGVRNTGTKTSFLKEMQAKYGHGTMRQVSERG